MQNIFRFFCVAAKQFGNFWVGKRTHAPGFCLTFPSGCETPGVFVAFWIKRCVSARI